MLAKSVCIMDSPEFQHAEIFQPDFKQQNKTKYPLKLIPPKKSASQNWPQT